MKSYVLMFIESQWHSLNIHDFNEYNVSHSLNKKDVLFTFQTSDLIREFNTKQIKILPTIIDIESFDKQMSQEGKEFRVYNKWNAIQFLKHHKAVELDFKLTESNFKVFMEHLASLLISLLQKDKIEKKRFEELELKVNQIIYNTQLKGVGINLIIAQEKCREIEKKIYGIKNILQFDFEIYTPDNDKFQLDYLKTKGFSYIQSPLYSFKARKDSDPVCNLLYELIRNTQDLHSLLYIVSHWGGAKKTYPTYLGFGTITSRIILRQPSLQNLRKVNRNVIVPDKGMELLYIDYSQCEAGILASLSKDKKLIELYKTDIYTDLAEKVIGNKDKRAEAKILFYRYMYGDDTLSRGVKSYFKEFKALEKFIKEIDREVKEKGKIGTLNGNFRHKLKDDDTYSWSLSHIIQSTASLIYKNALISVHEGVKYSEFLIPMHDGTLYQIPELYYEDCKKQIEEIYTNEFKKICPDIEVLVRSDKSFGITS